MRCTAAFIQLVSDDVIRYVRGGVILLTIVRALTHEPISLQSNVPASQSQPSKTTYTPQHLLFQSC